MFKSNKNFLISKKITCEEPFIEISNFYYLNKNRFAQNIKIFEG